MAMKSIIERYRLRAVFSAVLLAGVTASAAPTSRRGGRHLAPGTDP